MTNCTHSARIQCESRIFGLAVSLSLGHHISLIIFLVVFHISFSLNQCTPFKQTHTPTYVYLICIYKIKNIRFKEEKKSIEKKS